MGESEASMREENERQIARVELDFDRNLRHVEEEAGRDEDRVNAQMESARADRERIEGRMVETAKALEKRIEVLEMADQTRAARKEEGRNALVLADKAATAHPASPTLSDAPPTQSLVQFDSPVPSPAPLQRLSTPVAAPSFAPTTSHKSTPFRFGGAASSSTSSRAATPVSALPAHMLASASTSRRSPRTSTVQPESPAAPTPNAFLGKRSRDSTASDTSIGVEAVASPPKMQLPVYPSVLGGPSSVRKEDGHSRKRLRMSSAAHEEETARAIEQEEEEEPVDSFSKSAGAREDSFDEEEEEEESEHEDSNDSVRDYLMPTKTGDDSIRDYWMPTKTGNSPAFTLRPLNPDPNCNALSTSDPSFFAAPISPSRSTPGRRSTVNENARPTTAEGPRKSLPMTSLPFPLVSPFASETRPTATSFGTPATTALGNVSNQHFPSFSTKKNSKSASKAVGSYSTSRLPPMTPPASRTLFGTERLPFSDGDEMIGNEGKERFEDDDFETAEEDNTGNWSRFGGAFSRV